MPPGDYLAVPFGLDTGGRFPANLPGEKPFPMNVEAGKVTVVDVAVGYIVVKADGWQGDPGNPKVFLLDSDEKHVLAEGWASITEEEKKRDLAAGWKGSSEESTFCVAPGSFAVTVAADTMLGIEAIRGRADENHSRRRSKDKSVFTSPLRASIKHVGLCDAVSKGALFGESTGSKWAS